MKKVNNSTIERSNYPVKILQFGDGNFLRGFVDWMIEKANRSGIMNHGISIVQPRSPKLSTTMIEQDCMFHVYLEGFKDGRSVKDITLVKSVQAIINPHLEYQRYENLFLDSELQLIISNTTEAGIVYDETDDVWALPPQSFPAKMMALLYKRFVKYDGALDKGVHVVCTELIENNGSTLKSYIIKHAEKNMLHNFIQWLLKACYFYDTLVDRIVSGFPKTDVESIKLELGYDDNLIVKGEYFHVWAIGGNPLLKNILPLHKVEELNVLFMDDISNFRERKVRILNGAHTAMVSIALLLGQETVADAINSPLVEDFVKSLVSDEVLPILQGDEKELNTFAKEILERFYNPSIQHYLKDISLNSLSKWQVRNLPTLVDNETRGNSAKLTAFSLAALLALYSGSTSINFVARDEPNALAFIQAGFDVENIEEWLSKIIENKDIWQSDVSVLHNYIPLISDSIKTILGEGMEVALFNILRN